MHIYMYLQFVLQVLLQHFCPDVELNDALGECREVKNLLAGPVTSPVRETMEKIVNKFVLLYPTIGKLASIGLVLPVSTAGMYSLAQHRYIID